MADTAINVAVIGAGINGLACALKIKDKFRNINVVVFSDEYTPNTTGDGSGGLWYPYLVGNTSEEKIVKWGAETYKFLHELWLEGGHNVCLVPLYVVSKKNVIPRQKWADQVFGYHDLELKQLKYLNQLYSAKYISGHTFTSFVSTAPCLLKCIQERFISMKGEVKMAKLTSLQDPVLAGFDVVVNCSGLGARHLVPDDKVFPIRGQITKVIAPWINETILDDSGDNYIIPNAKCCVLGGTHQENDWSTNVNTNDLKSILDGCKTMIPSLKDVEIISHWVGLRPGRAEVRLEEEWKDGKLFIHNYGHGGCGLTLFWGCATDVVKILEKHLNKTKSKL